MHVMCIENGASYKKYANSLRIEVLASNVRSLLQQHAISGGNKLEARILDRVS